MGVGVGCLIVSFVRALRKASSDLSQLVERSGSDRKVGAWLFNLEFPGFMMSGLVKRSFTSAGGCDLSASCIVTSLFEAILPMKLLRTAFDAGSLRCSSTAPCFFFAQGLTHPWLRGPRRLADRMNRGFPSRYFWPSSSTRRLLRWRWSGLSSSSEPRHKISSGDVTAGSK